MTISLWVVAVLVELRSPMHRRVVAVVVKWLLGQSRVVLRRRTRSLWVRVVWQRRPCRIRAAMVDLHL
ncbi:MAG: hypothetical protein LW596_08480 [Ilumatobacteraceae bacterium]|nr:hypothetical protein [Ilumatobacteraceae bacterium]